MSRDTTRPAPPPRRARAACDAMMRPVNGITIDWSLIDWKWFFTTTLAVYAAVLATYREVVSRGQWKPDLKVRLSFSIVLVGDGRTIPQVQVWVENHGRCDILFNSNSVSIAAKGSDNACLLLDPISNVSFPHTLKPGGSFYFLKDKAPIIAAPARRASRRGLRRDEGRHL